MALATWITILVFYTLLLAFFFWKRQQVERQAKIILLYRMKWGLRWMDHAAQKFREWIILLAYIGIGAGFIGLLFISFTLIKNLFDLLTKPDAISGVQPVLPGMNIPGVGVLPFVDWVLAIFIIALVHEFAHGVVARAHHLTVKNTGLVLFGPILGAFVEPDEKKLKKLPDTAQYSILAAGSFANILLAILGLLLLSQVFQPLQAQMVTPTGFSFAEYVGEDYPAQHSKLQPGTTITGIEGKPTATFQEFAQELALLHPGQEIKISTVQGVIPLTLTQNPDDAQRPFLGINAIKNEFEVQPSFQQGVGKVAYLTTSWLVRFLGWLFLLSAGIGVFNLLPLPLVDGGRMAQVFLHKLRGPLAGEHRYRQVSLFFLVILGLNLLFWFWDTLL